MHIRERVIRKKINRLKFLYGVWSAEMTVQRCRDLLSLPEDKKYKCYLKKGRNNCGNVTGNVTARR